MSKEDYKLKGFRYKVIIAFPDDKPDNILCSSIQNVREWVRMANNHPSVIISVIDLITGQKVTEI